MAEEKTYVFGDDYECGYEDGYRDAMNEAKKYYGERRGI